MSDERDSYFPLCSGDPIGASALLVEKDKELGGLRTERDTFYMDYRMKCDEETKALHVECERLRAEVADAKRKQNEALGFAYAWCCSLLDTARDPRNVEVPQLIADWDAAIGGEKKDENA